MLLLLTQDRNNVSRLAFLLEALLRNPSAALVHLCVFMCELLWRPEVKLRFMPLETPTFVLKQGNSTATWEQVKLAEEPQGPSSLHPALALG